MNQVMYGKEEVIKNIKEGKNLVLAGDESVLKDLPEGNWIAGTIPYFMAEKGGLFSKDQIYVTEVPSYIEKCEIKSYTEDSISSVYSDAPENGFSIIIIPATSPTHLSFALKAPNFPDFATKPLIGWIAGVFLDELDSLKPKVFSGSSAQSSDNSAVVMHIGLPETKYADIEIINIFKAGDGDAISFPENGFNAETALINGEERNFAEYILEKDLDTKLPLVADYQGVIVNTSFQDIDEDNKIVNFYAPIFQGLDYKHARQFDNYIEEFTGRMPKDGIDRIFFSCNCILNYLYSELEGKQTGGITGPITFGEIAYQLLNQTMVYLTINDH